LVPKSGSGCGCCGPGSTTCSPCSLPNTALTLTGNNVFSGSNVVTLTYSGSNQWTAGCDVNGLQYFLACNGGTIELRVIFILSGSCPTGQSNYCSNLRAAPLELVLSGAHPTCSPLNLIFLVTNADCPLLFGAGWTSFTLTL